MKPVTVLAVAAVSLIAPRVSLLAQTKQPITFEKFLALQISGDPRLSPDGSTVAFTVTVPSLQENRNVTRLWIAPVNGGAPRQLPGGPGSDLAPRWSPDGKSLAFISTRSGSPQVWWLVPAGGDATQLTNVASGVNDFLWAPDGSALYVTSDVKWPAEGQEIDQRNGAFPTQAKIWDDLMYRHWNEWRVGLRSHLLRVSLADQSTSDLTPFDHDVPPLALGGADVSVSSSGEILVVYNPDEDVAQSTNNDVFLLRKEGGAPEQGHQPERQRPLAGDFAGRHPDRVPVHGDPGLRGGPDPADAVRPRHPPASLDHRRLGSQRPELRVDPGFEDPRPGDRGAGLPPALYAGCRERESAPGSCPEDSTAACRFPRMESASSSSARPPRSRPRCSPSASMAAVSAPWRRSTRRRWRDWTWPRWKASASQGGAGDSVQAWLLKPPAFDPARKYPLMYIVHGGPQVPMLDYWGARWNYHMFASRGYVVAVVNFHGIPWMGAEIHQQHQQTLGRLPLRRPDEGPRRGGRPPVRRQHSDGRRRRVIRRLHDQLDAGPHRSLQGDGLSRLGFSIWPAPRAPPKSSGSPTTNSERAG
jgi:hypothetical protein